MNAQVNLLAVSVGNTRTQFGLFLRGQVTHTAAVVNSEPGKFAAAVAEMAERLPEDVDAAEVPVVLASVNPAVAEKLAGVISGAWTGSLLRVEEDLPIPIGRQVDHEAIVGQDRLLAAAAAYDVLRQAVVVVDAGTAITIDFVDGAGTFHGGAIGPGAQLMLDSLHQRTALLPEVKFAPPEEAIGHNTTQAMLTATFHGLRGMVRELVEQYAEVAGTFPLVVATGGDAQVLFEHCDFVDRIVPELTLRGIAVALGAAEGAGEE
ncbi:MAG: type III pantothenate kinase [Phycisphaeraceae bacterium]|nr:type III pantothenate kinase [Phycisphaeraceae bacterium]